MSGNRTEAPQGRRRCHLCRQTAASAAVVVRGVTVVMVVVVVFFASSEAAAVATSLMVLLPLLQPLCCAQHCFFQVFLLFIHHFMDNFLCIRLLRLLQAGLKAIVIE